MVNNYCYYSNLEWYNNMHIPEPRLGSKRHRLSPICWIVCASCWTDSLTKSFCYTDWIWIRPSIGCVFCNFILVEHVGIGMYTRGNPTSVTQKFSLENIGMDGPYFWLWQCDSCSLIPWMVSSDQLSCNAKWNLVLSWFHQNVLPWEVYLFTQSSWGWRRSVFKPPAGFGVVKNDE